MMNSVNDLYRQRQGPSPTACPPEPCVCGTCGMLECLCRPRFFAGQILTADDLNRLDAYIRGKQRLHNRQLHGWGVVNGLEVTCNPCGDGVAVGCGYALSPCGDDIVVCEPVTVDVCALIKCCIAAECRPDPCAPPKPKKPGECEAGEEEWILAIRYAEAPSRGVKPLRPPDCTGCGCGGQCGCGGACGGKCGCGVATQTKPRAAPVQCEPTVVCEGYAFEVYRKPQAVDDPRSPNTINPNSELLKRWQCCVALLIQQLPPLPGPLQVPNTEAQAQAWFQWITKLRTLLRRYFASHGTYNCDLYARFINMPFPQNGTLANAGAIFLAAVLLLIVWIDALLGCFCSALLPPCPAPSNEVRVPLASIHVSGQPCHVTRVCNWSVFRKFAVTFPSLQYWLGALPFGVALRKLLDQVCCFDLNIVLPEPEAAPPAVRPPGRVEPLESAPPDDGDVKQAQAAWQHANDLLNPTLDQPSRIDALRDLLLAALARSNKTLDFGTLTESLLGSAQQRAGGDGGLLDAETANLPQFFAANQLLRPIAAEMRTPALQLLARLAEGAPAPAPAPAPAAAAAAGTAVAQPDLKAELDALRTRLDNQAAEIEHLKREAAHVRARLPRGGG